MRRPAVVGVATDVAAGREPTGCHGLLPVMCGTNIYSTAGPPESLLS